VVWLELTHDLLTDPASESRSLREQRRQAEAAKKQAEEAKKQKEKYERDLRKSRLVTAVFGVLLIGTAVLLYLAVVANRLAKKLEAEREQSYQEEVDQAELQSVGIGGSWVPAATVIETTGRTEQRYLDLTKKGTSSRDQQVHLVQRHARFLARAADALYQIGHFKEGLAAAQSALTLLKGLKPSESSNPLVQITLADSEYQEGLGLLATGKIDQSKKDFESAAGLTTSPNNPEVKLDMIRVSVLSKIALGQAESQGLAYDQANLHFKDAMDLIDHFKDVLKSVDKNGGGTDDPLSWKVWALIGTATSQWDDNQALNWYGKASDIIRPIEARDSGNPQWKRVSAELAYDQGFSAMRLGQYDAAKNYYEKAESDSEILHNRDADNLLWRLIRVKSWRGLGLIHYYLGEWDLAQSLLNQAQQSAEELAGDQPSWTGAGFLNGVLFMALGDVQEFRYIQSTGIFKDIHDLDSAYQMFSKSLDILRKSEAAAPGNLEFARDVELVLARQGYLCSLQAGAVTGTDSSDKDAQKKAQDHVNQKEKEALDLYSQAFKELELVESISKDSPETLDDKSSLYRQTGDAQKLLNRAVEAKSSYIKAVAMLAALVKKAPSPRNFGQLAAARIVLGDAYNSAKESAEAFTMFESAMQAVTAALKDQPQDTGLIQNKALIQCRFSDAWYSRGDLKKALDELENTFTTIWAALERDYSDESLNSNFKTYVSRLDRIKNALTNPKT
jgi:tetratricopeptide (TPR) repeat protein